MAITVRPDEQQSKDVDTLKELLNLATSSKALLHAAKEYPSLVKELKREKEKNQRLEWAIHDLKRSIINYSDAKDEMMELANK